MKVLTAEALFFEQDKPILTDPMHHLTAAWRAAWQNLANFLKGVPVAPRDTSRRVQLAKPLNRAASNTPNVGVVFKRTGVTSASRPIEERAKELSPQAVGVLMMASTPDSPDRAPVARRLDTIVPKPLNKQHKEYMAAVEKTRVAYFNYQVRVKENEEELAAPVAPIIRKPRLVYVANNNGPILALRKA